MEGGEKDGCIETVKAGKKRIYCYVNFIYDPGNLPDHLA